MSTEDYRKGRLITYLSLPTQSIEAMPCEALEGVDVATLETATFALRDLISRYG